MAILNAQSAELAALLKDNPKRHNVETEIGINVLFIALTTISHCVGVKVVMWFKLSLFVLVCVFMLIINVGAGPREGSFSRSYTSHAFTPGWKPTGFNSTIPTVLQSTGVDDTHLGIDGPGGGAYSLCCMTVVTLVIFSCKGGEIRDVPLAMSFVYIVPLSLYPLIPLSTGSNVNYADPHLPRLWAKGKGGIALSPSALQGLPKALNLLFIISAYTAANTALYAASRAVFIVAQTYLPTKLANIFGRTNNGHTPLSAILLCSALGFLSLAGLSKYTLFQPRVTLSEVYTGTMACVNITLCVTFLRFKAGLKIMEKRGLLERGSDLYVTRLFRSRWQPLPAYIGIVGCAIVIIWSGIPPLYILIAREHLTLSSNLKSKAALVLDVVGYYIGPVIFATFYLFYKYITPRSFRVDLRDLTASHYVLGDLDYIEQENPNTNPRNASRAQRAERQRIQDILERQPPTWERGFWREMWSFVVV
ncbi:hypothetical protein B0O99DRAFT_664761 [Bisporella sp. PMI_857]|nr:hypothetical protein B0O99DRAFT_664761 [Bisporella sp. PMI_857]